MNVRFIDFSIRFIPDKDFKNYCTKPPQNLEQLITKHLRMC